jgi:hypothetical protein
MKYKVVELIKRLNWEGVIFEDEKGNRKITSGIYIWEAKPERVAKCEIINNIDKELFLKRWYENYKTELVF